MSAKFYSTTWQVEWISRLLPAPSAVVHIYWPAWTSPYRPVAERASMIAKAKLLKSSCLNSGPQTQTHQWRPPLTWRTTPWRRSGTAQAPQSLEYDCSNDHHQEQCRIYTMELDKLDIGVLRSKVQLYERRSRLPKERSTSTGRAVEQEVCLSLSFCQCSSLSLRVTTAVECFSLTFTGSYWGTWAAAAEGGAAASGGWRAAAGAGGAAAEGDHSQDKV